MRRNCTAGGGARRWLVSLPCCCLPRAPYSEKQGRESRRNVRNLKELLYTGVFSEQTPEGRRNKEQQPSASGRLKRVKTSQRASERPARPHNQHQRHQHLQHRLAPDGFEAVSFAILFLKPDPVRQTLGNYGLSVC